MIKNFINNWIKVCRRQLIKIESNADKLIRFIRREINKVDGSDTWSAARNGDEGISGWYTYKVAYHWVFNHPLRNERYLVWRGDYERENPPNE